MSVESPERYLSRKLEVFPMDNTTNDTEPINPEWMTVDEFAKAVGVVPSRVRQWVNDEPPVIASVLRAGRRWIHRDQIALAPKQEQGGKGRPRGK